MAQRSASRHGSSEITYMDAALYKALAHGDINFLKNSSADFRVQLTPNKNSVLHIAAQFGQADCMKRILQMHSCLSLLLLQPNLKGDTPLHLAARGGHLTAVEALVDAAKALPKETEGGVEPDKAILRATNYKGDTALNEAVRFQHPKVVKLLIEEDPSLTSAANIWGETPLYIAAESGFHELVKIIIDSGSTISPAHTDFNGSTELHAAVIGNHKEIAKQMLQWNPYLAAEVDENGWSPLHCAAHLGYTSIVKELLEKSEKWVVYLGVKNDDNKTALHIAASRGHVDIVKLLLSHSPDCCEQVDDKGNNALHFLMPLIRIPRLTINSLPVRWLNVRGLLNEKNELGQTPVQLLTAFVSSMMNFPGEKIPLQSIWRSAKARSAWQKVAKPDEISNSSASKERDEEVSAIKTASQSHLVVAALIATVTFAAGFTLPGGYIQSGGENQGMAVLTDAGGFNNALVKYSNHSIVEREAFKAFIWTDAIALVFSMMAVTIHFLMALYINKQILRKLFHYAYCLTLLSIFAMLLAFFSGLLAVLRPSTMLETSVKIMTTVFLLVLAAILHYSPYPDNSLLFDEGKFFSPYFVLCFLAGAFLIHFKY